MIRLATLEDMPQLLRMGESFYLESGYQDMIEFNQPDVRDMLEQLINMGTLVTNGDSAMLGFVIFPMFLNKKSLMAQELFWWVDKGKRGSSDGIKLLNRAEEIAKQSGASIMNMLSLNDSGGDKVNALYERKGYTRKEQSYMRVL